jgi:hypothetical protein
MKESKKKHLEMQAKYCELQALWWMNSATNGHAKTRVIKKGVDGPPMSDEELVSDAMRTSQRHLDNYFQIMENLTSELD